MTLVQLSAEVYLNWKDLDGNWTHNLHNSGVMLYQLSFQALREQGGGK